MLRVGAVFGDWTTSEEKDSLLAGVGDPRRFMMGELLSLLHIMKMEVEVSVLH